MTWTNEPSLSLPRQGLAAAVCDAPSPGSGYRIYAIGGDDDAGDILATVEAYDTSAAAWSSVVPMSTPRTNLAASPGIARIYALGGSDGVGPLATHEIYDPAAGAGGAWSSGPALPTARESLAAVTGRDGNIYALGGYNGAYLTTVEAFNPTTNAWITGASAPPPMHTARFALAAVTGPDGLIYAIGGANASGALSTVERYNPSTKTWALLPATLPQALSNLAASVGPDGLIYVVGGQNNLTINQSTVYSYDPAATNPQWTTQAPLPAPTGQGFLAAATGPDGLIYAIGGADPAITGAVEAFTVPATATAPDPYIGDGTYQSPDIILLKSGIIPIPTPTPSPIAIGGAPGGAWDTLLLPTTNYDIQAVIYNDANIAAPNTIVRFWRIPNGVSTGGTLISEVTGVTVPANGSVVVNSSSPFLSGALGAHVCVVVSVSNPQSPYFSADPTTATAVIDPTVPHPAGSNHYGSAWRNTNSVAMPPGMIIRWPFGANFSEIEPVRIKLEVTAAKVAIGWDKAPEIAKIRRVLEGAGAQLRKPLFLIPEIRSHLPAADCDLRIHAEAGGKEVRSKGKVERHVDVRKGADTLFTVTGAVPRDAKKGDIFLVNVAAHYPATRSAKEKVVEYLEVIYVRA